ncbi:hypothetical protein QAD02_019788 [Eretmocerus hayati]|uniref:Uncharacterized protein n=1 Tax=Eretmocerus hayati TaxID=131215 RepID=A0ACC2PME1_9HYME|nr:hypothetical protein QAD02_019788 [Eretmocerus hayati]
MAPDVVLLSILNFKDGFKLCSAGEPGYLDFDNLPETNFSCQGKVIGGYYADVEAGCQMFHVCTIGQKDEIMDIKFLCLNGTVFDQETRVCERVDEVDCSKSERFYNLNLELYGNNAVTLSLHEEEDDDDSTESRDEQQQQQHHHMTSSHPSTTTTTTTTTPRPTSPPTTSTIVYNQQQPTGYPQHYQPRPAFHPAQTSQSNTRYDDKNGGYHHQYIFHNDERSNNNQATSYQLFSNQGPSSTTPTPQSHQQVRYAATNQAGVHGETSTTMPLQYHVQSTQQPIQTLLNNNANNPSLINPLYHNHGIARPPDALQSTNKGKVSQMPIPSASHPENHPSLIQAKNNQSSQQPRISLNYLPTSNPTQTTVRVLYPTQRPPALQKPQKFQLKNPMNQHNHAPLSSPVTHEKSHQITISLPPSDVHRIVQNPSPLLPSQSRVIVTAKASVSDESGRPLNASQLITLPIANSNYDDYKEGEESFDPFYRDVPKIRNDQRIIVSRRVETSGLVSRKKRSVDDGPEQTDSSGEVIFNAEIKDIKDLKANLPIIKAILFGLPIPDNEEPPLDPGNIDFEDPQVYEPDEESSQSSNKSLTMQSFIISSTPYNIDEEIYYSKPESVTGESQVQPTGDSFGAHRHSIGTAAPREAIQLYLNGNQESGLLSRLDDPNRPQKSANHILNVNETNNINRELSQLQDLPTPKGSNKRRNRYRQRSGEVSNHAPRRTSQMGRLKPPQLYDEYDASESIEISSKQRANRYRSKERPVVKYQDDYFDEDELRDRDYDDRYLYRSRSHRRRPQGRRIPTRNRNRHLDYEYDVEVHEKPDSVNKDSYGNSDDDQTDDRPARYEGDRRSRITSERRMKTQKQQTATPTHLGDFETNATRQNSTEIKSSTTTELYPSKPAADDILDDHLNDGNARVSEISTTRERGSLSTDKEFDGKQDESKGDDPVANKNRPEESDGLVGRYVTDDYPDYFVPRYQTGRTRMDHRKNKNRSRKVSSTPRRGSRRRNKGRFPNVANEYAQETYDTTETQFEDTTAVVYDLSTRAPEPLSKHQSSGEQIRAEEYEEHKATEPTLRVNNTGTLRGMDEESVAQDVSTEGVSIFTDEITRSASSEDGLENDSPLGANEEDYVDDNYEAAIFESSENDSPTTLSSTFEDEDGESEGEELKTEKEHEPSPTLTGRLDEKKVNKSRENITVDKLDLGPTKAYDDKRFNNSWHSASSKTSLSPTSTSILPDPKLPGRESTTLFGSVERSSYEFSTNVPTTLSNAYSSPSPTSSTTLKSRTSTKFVKPSIHRKNISHPLPSSTSNPVTTKNTSTTGPKPTKPPPTYNDLGSKPVIRRLPLLSRTTTTTSEASILEDDEISAKLVKQFAEEANKHLSAIKGSDSDEKLSGFIIKTPTTDSPYQVKSKTSIETSTLGAPDNENNLRNEISKNQRLPQLIHNQTKEQILDNEVPKYNSHSSETNDVPQNTDDISNGISRTRTQSTTSNSISATNLERVENNSKVPKIRTTTQRAQKPSERRKLELTSVKSQILRDNQGLKQLAGFNCLEKEMYRFYGDARDCRLFHYCSPGFTTRQVLDFRFVCEEGTIFDESSQSCLHDVPNPKCVKRNW